MVRFRLQIMLLQCYIIFTSPRHLHLTFLNILLSFLLVLCLYISLPFPVLLHCSQLAIVTQQSNCPLSCSGQPYNWTLHSPTPDSPTIQLSTLLLRTAPQFNCPLSCSGQLYNSNVHSPAPGQPHNSTVHSPAPRQPHNSTVHSPAPEQPHNSTVHSSAPRQPHNSTVQSPAPGQPHNSTVHSPALGQPHNWTVHSPTPESSTLNLNTCSSRTQRIASFSHLSSNSSSFPNSPSPFISVTTLDIFFCTPCVFQISEKL